MGRGRRRAAAAVVLVLALLAAAAIVAGYRGAFEGPDAEPPRPTPTPTPTPAAPGIRVVGNTLVDDAGRPLQLAGFNLSGGEYACMEGFGLFDTPDGSVPSDAQVAAMAAWTGAALVRVPLNEQCWLGIGGVRPAYGGAAYRAAVQELVTRLNAHGLVVVLDLHRSAPGTAASLTQEPMPDRDHSISFWSSVASTFANRPAVAFDLFNEPYPFKEENTTRAWRCWRDGGCRLRSNNSKKLYTAAGMQELLDAVRATGARNVVFAGGILWAQGMTRWLEYRPRDPLGQLGAAFHVYSFNTYCAKVSCFERDLTPILAKVPLLAGEVGPDLPPDIEDFDTTCPPSAVGRSGFSRRTLAWLTGNGAAWTAWSWTPTGDCWSLVSDWDGRATTPWGALVRDLLRARVLTSPTRRPSSGPGAARP